MFGSCWSLLIHTEASQLDALWVPDTAVGRGARQGLVLTRTEGLQLQIRFTANQSRCTGPHGACGRWRTQHRRKVSGALQGIPGHGIHGQLMHFSSRATSFCSTLTAGLAGGVAGKEQGQVLLITTVEIGDGKPENINVRCVFSLQKVYCRRLPCYALARMAIVAADCYNRFIKGCYIPSSSYS